MVAPCGKRTRISHPHGLARRAAAEAAVRRVARACRSKTANPMSFPPKLKAKYLTRFDEPITEGRAVLASVVVIPPHSRGNVHVISTSYQLDFRRLIQWTTS